MSTLNQITDNIYNIYRNFSRSDDDSLTKRQIIFEILYYRALILRRDIAKNGFDYSLYESPILCQDLVDAPLTECCEYNSLCTVKRIATQLPELVRTKGRIALVVTSIDDSKDIPLIYHARARYVSAEKYIGDQPMSFYRDRYVYIINDPLIKRINLRPILVDPRMAAQFKCDGVTCYTDNDEFPIGADMIEAITKGILTNELNIARYGVQDNTNDGKYGAQEGPRNAGVRMPAITNQRTDEN